MIEETADRARAALLILVTAAVAELARLGPEPILIASAPDKFNDAYSDDYWFAVQIGERHWEQSQFFGGDRAFATEKAHLVVTKGSPDLGTSLIGNEDILAARKILARLQSAHWRDLVERAFEKRPICALILQYGQAWLQLSDPMGDLVCYLVTADDFVFFASEDDRVDRKVGAPNLIRPNTFAPAAERFLSAEVRRQFRPSVIDEQTARALARDVRDCGRKVGSITDRPVLVRAAHAAYDRKRYRHVYSEYNADLALVAVNEVSFHRNTLSNIVHGQMAEHVRAERLDRFNFVNFPALFASIDAFATHHLRAGFERALGVDTYDSEDLWLLLHKGAALIIHRTIVLTVHDDTIQLAGHLDGALSINTPERTLSKIAVLDPGSYGHLTSRSPNQCCTNPQAAKRS